MVGTSGLWAYDATPRTNVVNRLLRFPGAVRRDPAVDAWFDGRGAQFGAMAREWFLRMRDCGPDVRELLHDGHPTACVGDAAFAYTNVFTAHVNVGFFQGAALPDPAGLLQGDGRYMRHVKLKPGTATDTSALEALISVAYWDIKTRLGLANEVPRPDAGGGAS